MTDHNRRCLFTEEERLGVIRTLNYYRYRLRSQAKPLSEPEVEDLCHTLEAIEGALLRVWPIMQQLVEDIAAQPFLDGGL